MRWLLLSFVCVGWLPGSPLAQGLPSVEGVRLIGADTDAGDLLGFCAAVAIVHDEPAGIGLPPPGPLAMGGAPGVPPNNAAYVFADHAGGWAQVQRIMPEVGGIFGVECALSEEGTVLVVGAPVRVEPPASGEFPGGVHVFRYDPTMQAWTDETVLRVADLGSSRYFGQSVGVARDGVGAAATEERLIALGGGRAWIMRRTNAGRLPWAEEARLEPDAGDSFQGLTANYGTPYHRAAIAHGSDGAWRALAGGPYSGGTPFRGAAYIWRLDSQSESWVREARFPGTPGACLGHGVTLAESEGVWLAAAGATQGCVSGGVGTGYVDVWRAEGDEWVLEARLVRPEAGVLDFGSSVALWAGTGGHAVLIVAGGAREDSSSPPLGAYVFERTPGDPGPASWQAVARLSTATPASPFGGLESVGVSASVAVVGNPSEDTAGLNAGAVFVYDLSGVLTPADAPPAPAGGLALSVAPHPVRGAGWLTLTLPAAAPARVAVFDLLGREVALVHDGALPAGAHRLAWPAGLAPGLYVVRAMAAGRVATRRVVVGP